ncbi:hypothetical protein NKJ93_02225 [Mesorhizobium sp. M0028]|uniref:hypothetical protein n=1 Tax=Mesorhizobium sp. M0028 TaxID=2956849 RepID=UPI003338F1C4
MRNFKHGKTGSPEYFTWAGMRQRCSNPKTPNYDRYGGRGISVCSRWANSFVNFYTDMGPRPSIGHTIERLENDGDYEPGNCVWAVKKRQANNTCRNIVVTYEGKTHTLAEWADRLRINYRTLHNRYTRGLSLDRVFALGRLARA